MGLGREDGADPAALTEDARDRPPASHGDGPGTRGQSRPIGKATVPSVPSTTQAASLSAKTLPQVERALAARANFERRAKKRGRGGSKRARERYAHADRVQKATCVQAWPLYGTGSGPLTQNSACFQL